MFENKISGLWEDTLFPSLKHMIGYGADFITKDNVDNWVDAAFDVAMGTMGQLAPALAPGMLALKHAYG